MLDFVARHSSAVISADAITEAMQACSACVVLLTSAANQSKALKRELELASHYEKPFIPIRVDGVEPAAGLDYYLRNTQWVEYARDGDEALDRIVDAGRDVSPPGQAASPPVLGPAPVPARAAASRTARVPIMVGAVLAVVAAGGWFAWPGGSEPTTTEEPSAADAGVLQLAGSYHWDGVDCGDGPTVTLEADMLVVTMPETETYRHTGTERRTRHRWVCAASGDAGHRAGGERGRHLRAWHARGLDEPRRDLGRSHRLVATLPLAIPSLRSGRVTAASQSRAG